MSIAPGYGSPQDKIEAASMTAEHWMLKAHEWQERAEKAEAENAALQSTLKELRTVLHSQGRRPEECYSMRLIDAALLAGKSP